MSTSPEERQPDAPLPIDLDAIEVATPKALEALNRAEIDMQIATAKKWPRKVSTVLMEVETMATLDQETADKCFYRLKRKDRDGKTTWIVGPSIRFAEIVLCAWGNVRHSVQIIDTEGDYAVARATVHDLEKNGFHASESVRQIVTNKNGIKRRYSVDMIQTTAMAAASIALRNATFKVIPMGMFHAILGKVDEVASGKSATIEQRRTEALKFWTSHKLTEAQVCAAVGKSKAEDLTRDDLNNLRGLARAIKDGETTLEAAFELTAPAGKTSLSDRIADTKAAVTAQTAPVREVVTPDGEVISEADRFEDKRKSGGAA